MRDGSGVRIGALLRTGRRGLVLGALATALVGLIGFGTLVVTGAASPTAGCGGVTAHRVPAGRPEQFNHLHVPLPAPGEAPPNPTGAA